MSDYVRDAEERTVLQAQCADLARSYAAGRPGSDIMLFLFNHIDEKGGHVAFASTRDRSVSIVAVEQWVAIASGTKRRPRVFVENPVEADMRARGVLHEAMTFLAGQAPKGTLFAAFVFDLVVPGVPGYISTAERSSAMEALREWLRHVRNERHPQGGAPS